MTTACRLILTTAGGVFVALAPASARPTVNQAASPEVTSLITLQTEALRRQIPRKLDVAFDARAKGWQAARAKACPTGAPACLAPIDQRRHTELAAIANRMPDNAVPITDLSAYVLTGAYKVAAMIDPAGRPAADPGAQLFEHLPAVGGVVTGHGVSICFDHDGCRAIGWTKQTIAWLPHDGEREATGLHLPKDTLCFRAFTTTRCSW